MDGRGRQRALVMLAWCGLLYSVLRLVVLQSALSFSLPSLPESWTASTEDRAAASARLSPRAVLADDLELFQMSVLSGSDYSLEAFAAVERDCRNPTADPLITKACTAFESDRNQREPIRALDDIVHELRAG